MKRSSWYIRFLAAGLTIAAAGAACAQMTLASAAADKPAGADSTRVSSAIVSAGNAATGNETAQSAAAKAPPQLTRRPVAQAAGSGTQVASAVTKPANGQQSVALELVPLTEKEKAEKKPAKKDDSTPDIELWLGERTGRWGDFEFSILGGRPGYPTPTGAFKIEWKSRSWWSKQWDAEMQYASFFAGGAAIHEGSLSTMSHGCVHVSMDTAKKVFAKGREGVTRVFVYP